MIANLAELTTQTLLAFWQGFLNFIPSLILAIIVFIIGWFIATWAGRIIVGILKKLKIDKVFERESWKQLLTRADLKVDVTGFIGVVVKWILVIVFLKIAVEILGWVAFADFLRNILAYLPNVIIAALIFVVAVIIIDIVDKVVRASVEGIRAGYGQIVSAIVKWSLWVFVILAILLQLGVAPQLMETLFTGIIAMLVISLGLAFGLGGKDIAAEILRNLKKKLKKEE